MSQAFTVEAEPREVLARTQRGARGALDGSRAWSMEGWSGHPVTVDPEGIREVLHSESGHNAIFTLEVRGKAPARAMIRDWQTEPSAAACCTWTCADRPRRQVEIEGCYPCNREPQGVKVQGESSSLCCARWRWSAFRTTSRRPSPWTLRP